jgi:hypothetical protein
VVTKLNIKGRKEENDPELFFFLNSSSFLSSYKESCRGTDRSFQGAIIALNCRTSSSDISGYHADFHEGHSAVGEWHDMCELTRHGMAWQGKGMGAA